MWVGMRRWVGAVALRVLGRRGAGMRPCSVLQGPTQLLALLLLQV